MNSISFFTSELLRTRRFLLTVPLSLLILLALPSLSLAQSALTDDVHVSLSEDKSNNGASPNLSVSPKENIYLKYNLSSVLPAQTPGSAVGRATLKLYAGSVKVAGKLGVYPVLGPWDENGITSANLPPLGRLMATTDLIAKEQEGKFIVIDITPLVRLWLGDDGQGTNGIPNNGLALAAYPVETVSPEGAEISFDSKENLQTSHEAQLNIQLESMAGGLQKVERDATLIGDGVTASPIGIASGGVKTMHLADGAVTGEKIAANAITSSGLANGVVTSSKIAVPLSLTSADPSFTLSVANTGAGAAITAAGTIDTSKQYNIGGQRILSTPGVSNLFAGLSAGLSNTIGVNNSFFGVNAGYRNTSGQSNSFFGRAAGLNNTTGIYNVFVGESTGLGNTTGYRNTIIGANANLAANNLSFATAIGADALVSTSNTVVLGRSADAVQIPGSMNVAGALNIAGLFSAQILNAGSYFSIGSARVLSTHGVRNLMAGVNSGIKTTGASNAFFGYSAGAGNEAGGSNAFFGDSAGFFNVNGSLNTFIGANAGISNTFGQGNIFIGYGAGNVSGSLVNNSIVIGVNQQVSTSGTILLGSSAHTTQVPGGMVVRAGRSATLTPAFEVATSATGGGVIANNLYFRQFFELGSPAHLCFRVSNAGVPAYVVTTCTSSLSSSEFKTESRPFTGGLDIIKRLNPVSFSWKGGGAREIGLNAEDVAEIEPLLITRNDKGQVEDVKENSLEPVFINAFKEQQKQIESQQEQIRRQQIQIDAMIKLICSTNPQADFCK
jgi:hypothetical protein